VVVHRPWWLAVGLVFAAPLHAQEQQTLFSGRIESGGFGGFVVRFSEVGGEFAVFSGARGGWIINHTLVLGGAGYGLASEISLTPGVTGRQIEFGYGGVELEYVNSWAKVAHFTVQGLIGAGGLTVKQPFTERSESVFVAEPTGNLELNFAKFFRLNVGVGYRFVSGVDDPDVTNGDLSGVFGQLTFKFGSF
jgi:hypothetical protein